MEDREHLIRERIAEIEKIDKMRIRGIGHFIHELLIKEKGFYPEEIQVNPQFRLMLSTCEAKAGIDFLITLNGKEFMVIQCVSSAMEPWERYTIAFARAILDYQIPYAAITDGVIVKIFDILNHSSKQMPVEGLLSRQEAINVMNSFQKIPCPEKNREMERRIIYAFEGIKCHPSTQDET